MGIQKDELKNPKKYEDFKCLDPRIQKIRYKHYLDNLMKILKDISKERKTIMRK